MQFWYNVFVVHNASANDHNVTVIEEEEEEQFIYHK